MTTNSTEWFADPTYWNVARSFIWSDLCIEMSGQSVSRIIELLGMKKGESVLDLACGFGRHSFEFHNHGLSVTGVDLNPNLIEEAKAKAENANANISFICSDMRDYKELRSYNYVVILFNSFGYFEKQEDDDLVLQNCWESLIPGGKILLNIMPREVYRLSGTKRKKRYWVENDGKFRLEEFEANEDWSWANISWILLDGDDRKTFEIGIRLYSIDDLEQLLKKHGFCDVRSFGNLKGDPYDANVHNHLVNVVARKPK